MGVNIGIMLVSAMIGASFNGNILAVGSTYEEVETDNYGKIYMYKL